MLLDVGFVHIIHPSLKGTLWSRIGLGLKFVHLSLLTKKYGMGPFGNCIIAHQTYIMRSISHTHASTLLIL